MAHPFPRSYEIVVVPATTPVTTPVVPSTVAFDVLLRVQVPPPLGLARVVVDPSQTMEEPVIAPGVWLTVTTDVAGVPQPLEYVISAVPPATPVTMPELEPTVATLVFDDVHAPKPPGLVSVVVRPEQTVCVPAFDPGLALTVNTAVAAQPDTV